MTTASIDMSHLTMRLTITRPRGYRIRMALMAAALWVAGRVAPSCVEVQSEIVP